MLLLYTPATSFFLGELFSSVSINKILQSLPFFPKLSNRKKWKNSAYGVLLYLWNSNTSVLSWWTGLHTDSTLKPRCYSGNPDSLLFNSNVQFQRQLRDIFKPTQLTSPVPFQHYYGTFIFFLCRDNGIRVSECWKTIQNYYSSPIHLMILLLF